MDELGAESIFCCEFSATSQSSRDRGEIQVESCMMSKTEGSAVEELRGYLALHVSFAHITPSWLAGPAFRKQVRSRKVDKYSAVFVRRVFRYVTKGYVEPDLR